MPPHLADDLDGNLRDDGNIGCMVGGVIMLVVCSFLLYFLVRLARWMFA